MMQPVACVSRAPDSHYNNLELEQFDPSTLHALVCIQDLTSLEKTNALYGAIGSPMPNDLKGQGMVHLAYGVAHRWLSEQGD